MVGGYVMPSARIYVGGLPKGAARGDSSSLADSLLKLRDVLSDLAWERHWIVCKPPIWWIHALVDSRLHAPLRARGTLVGVAIAPGPIGSVERMPWLMLSPEYLHSLDLAGARALTRQVKRLRHPNATSVTGLVLLVRRGETLYTMPL